MWVITTGGFVSAVEHRDNKDLVMVRARDKQSLTTMIEGIELAGNAINAAGETLAIEKDLEPIASDTADYRWRVTISKATFALWLQHEVLSYLNYPNFKSALAKHRGADFSRAAHRVWDDMQLVSDGVQVYGGVGVGGKRINKPVGYYASEYYGAGTYKAGKYGAGTEKKVGSSFFSAGSEAEKEWNKGYHGMHEDGDGLVEDEIGLDPAFIGEDDIPEIPEGADEWTDEEFELWLETGEVPGGQAAALELTPEELEELIAKNDAQLEGYPRTFSFPVFESGIRGTQAEAAKVFDEQLEQGWGDLVRMDEARIIEQPQEDGTMKYAVEAVVDVEVIAEEPREMVEGESSVISVSYDSKKPEVEPVLDFETAKKELQAITSKPTFQQKKQSKYAAKKEESK